MLFVVLIPIKTAITMARMAILSSSGIKTNQQAVLRPQIKWLAVWLYSVSSFSGPPSTGTEGGPEITRGFGIEAGAACAAPASIGSAVKR